MEILILCPRGLEEVLSKEISKIIYKRKFILCKGHLKVFNCNFEDVYKINLYSRTASRILLKLGKGKVRNNTDVYNLSYGISWNKYFHADNTIRVRVEGRSYWCKNIDFLALKIKDSICDSFRNSCGIRPNVDKDNPKIRISAYIKDEDLDLYLDTSGQALFKRGWRQNAGYAPIRENLAAGLLLMCGFETNAKNFLDPMCGSGTFAIEASLIAINKAPGLSRSFAFENFIGFDVDLWDKIKQQAKSEINKNIKIKFYSSDISSRMINIARNNAKLAGVLDLINFDIADFLNIKPLSSSGFMITNPSYGERLSDVESLRTQYPSWSKVLKEFYSDWQVAFITSDLEFYKYLRLKPKNKIIVYNGKIECRLYVFDMVKGSNRNSSLKKSK